MKSFFLIVMLAFSIALYPDRPVSAQTTQEATAPAPSAPKTVFPEQLPDHYPTLQAMAARALAEQNHDALVRIMEKSYEIRPYDYQVMAQLVISYALQEERTKAYNMMLIMQQQGVFFDFNQLPQTENIRDTQTYTYINNLLIEAGEPFATSGKAFELPEAATMPEAIAFDEKTSRFYVGTIRDPGIYILDSDGNQQTNVPDFEGIDYAIFDIAIDSNRRHLWASTSAISQQSTYKTQYFGKHALLKFDIDTGELLANYNIKPDGKPHGFGNLALASDGTVYIADIRSPTVHQLPAGKETIEVLATGSALPSIRGISLNEQEQLLYLADQVRGIAFIDLKNKRPYIAGVKGNINLGGIEGIEYWNGHLFAIQPGIRPARMMQLLLTSDGRGILAAKPLDANHPDFHAPNYGVLAMDNFFYMASSHWTAFDGKGNRLPGSSLAPVSILKTPLRQVTQEETAPPSIQDAIRQRQQQSNGIGVLKNPEPDDNNG